MSDEKAYERAKERARNKLRFYNHLVVYAAVILFLAAVNLITSPQELWFIWPLMGWGLLLVIHAGRVFLMEDESEIVERMAQRELDKKGPRSG